MFSYIAIFYVFTVNKKTIIRQFSMSCFFLVSAIAYTQYEKDLTKSIDIMGYLCCAITVVFFAAPLTKLIHVIKVKSSESLPFPLILTSFFVTLQWFIYGNLIGDKFLQVNIKLYDDCDINSIYIDKFSDTKFFGMYFIS